MSLPPDRPKEGSLPLGGKARSAKRAHIGVRAVLAVLACLIAQSVFAFDVAELMAMMAKVERSTVVFQETKHVAALTTPLIRRGTLRYVRPDQLQMHVEEPYFERMSITGERLTIETRKGKREIELSAQPAVAAWIESLRATLSGDLNALNRYYRIQLTGQRDGWKLELHPLERNLAELVQRVELSGSQAQLSRVTIEERQGDRAVLVLSPSADTK